MPRSRSRIFFIAAGAVLLAATTVAVIRQVSAATFDSNIVPSTAQTLQIGTAAGDWRGINNTIFFSGSNVGISNSSFTPGERLHVQGDIKVESGDVYIDSSSYGLILKAPNASCWRIGVTNAGVVTTTAATCL